MTDIAVLLMAAGSARRMGGPNKLLLPLRGRPLLAHAAQAAEGFGPAWGVTGRDAAQTGAILAAHDITELHNARFAEGFGTSLGCGFRHLQAVPGLAGALILLGDMPDVTAAHLALMAAQFRQAGGGVIVRASSGEALGNPVIVPAALFAAFAALDGEASGRDIIRQSGLRVHAVDIGPAALNDIDTPDAYATQEGAE